MADKEKQSPKRGHKPKIPIDYLWSVADAIAQMNPTKEIVYNKVLEVYCEAFSKGVLWRLDGAKMFKDKQNAHFKEYWDKLQDYIDDVIHGVVEPNQTK